MGDEGGQLGIAGFAGEALGLGDQGLQACGVLQGGVGVVQLACGLQVVAVQVVGGAVVQAVVFQQVVFVTAQGGGFTFQPGGERLDGPAAGDDATQRSRARVAYQIRRALPCCVCSTDSAISRQ